MQYTNNIMTVFKIHLYVDVYWCTDVSKCSLKIMNKFPTEKLFIRYRNVLTMKYFLNSYSPVHKYKGYR